MADAATHGTMGESGWVTKSTVYTHLSLSNCLHTSPPALYLPFDHRAQKLTQEQVEEGEG